MSKTAYSEKSTYAYVIVTKDNHFEEAVVVPSHMARYFVMLEHAKTKANVRDFLTAAEAAKNDGKNLGRAA